MISPKRRLDDAAYFRPVDGFKSSFANAVTHASLETVTKSPTFNLENVQAISKITCTLDQMDLYFTSEAYSAAAFKTWSQTPDLTFIPGNHCSASLYRFSKIELDGSVVSLRVQDTQFSEIIEEFDLEISTTKSQKDRYLAAASSVISKPLLSIPLNANYNSATKQAVNRSIPILEHEIASLYCQDCYTKGSLDLYFRIKGRPGLISAYEIRLDGQLVADFGLAFSLDTGAVKTQRMNIFRYPITPINLAGLFVFGPEVSLSISSEFTAQARINALTGVVATIPLSAQISKRPNSPVKAQNSISSRLAFKNLTVSAGAKASATANIHPEISLSLRGLSGLVDFGASLDFRQSAIVTADMCTYAQNRTVDRTVGTSLYWEQRRRINVKVGGIEKEVYQSRPLVYNLPCAKCYKCPA